jgi:PAS domain-containing protein
MIGMKARLWARLRHLLEVIGAPHASEGSGSHRMDHDTCDYNDVKTIEQMVETFKELVSRLSRDGRQLSELYAKAERRAAHYALLSETVVESITSGIIVVERSGEVTLANSAALSLLGIDQDIDVTSRKIGDLFKDSAELTALIQDNFTTGANSRRQIATARTLDGRLRRIGVSTTCVRSSASAAEAVIVIFTELEPDEPSRPVPVQTLNIPDKIGRYAAGVLDCYGLLASATPDLGLIEGKTRNGVLSKTDLVEFIHRVKGVRDLIMAFGLAAKASEALCELVDIGPVVQFLVRKDPAILARVRVEGTDRDLPQVRTVRKVLETGLEMLISGCLAAGGDPVRIIIDIARGRSGDSVNLVLEEQGGTAELSGVSGSLKGLAIDRGLGREAGLMLLRSLAPESHRVTVARRQDCYAYSIAFAVPVGNKAGSGPRSDPPHDQGGEGV